MTHNDSIRLIQIVTVATLMACDSPAPTPVPPADPHASIAFEDPAACEGCHADQVSQWKKSMHAQAHHDLDPIYGKMRELRIATQGEATGQTCLACHQSEAPGVVCSNCHSAKAPLPEHVADGTTVCLTCHEVANTPSGVPACTTGPESREFEEKRSCTSCHMPDGSHEFLGPHHAWNHDDASFLATGVELDLELVGTRAMATLTNRSGHAFPTGFPGRMVVLEIVGKDSKGVPVGDPYRLVLNKVYVDADGKAVPAAFAKELKSDTRLEPGEARSVDHDFGPRVETVEATLSMRLLPPPLADNLGLADDKLAEPRVILRK